jgi:hypothetical protein
VASDRSTWPIRRFRLGEEPPEDESEETSAAERIAAMWRLAREGWALAGRSLPEYDRRSIPARLYRPGEAREEE